MKIVTIHNVIGEMQTCHSKNCFSWKFLVPNELPVCVDCKHIYDMDEGESFGVFPRVGREFWDSMNDLQRYSFLKSLDGQSIIKTPMSTGKYIEGDDACALAETADQIINELLAVVTSSGYDLSQLSEPVLNLIRKKG